MARINITSTDIHARLARGECANYSRNCCQGTVPCAVVEGGACDYFAQYVKPLLEYPDISAKYSREAKVTVGLNPKAKVVRKRREAKEPTLAIEAKPTAKPTSAPAAKPKMVTPIAPPAPAPVPVPAPALAAVTPPATPTRAKRQPPSTAPQLTLDLLAVPATGKTRKR